MSTLTNLTDEQLHERAVAAIWRAAAGESRGGDDPSYDRAMEVLAESNRRLVVAGHKVGCGGSIYANAYEQATAEHAYRTPERRPCTCGASR